MAQAIVQWFVSDGKFRVHAVNAVGRRKGRIIEVEKVDSRERLYGSGRHLERVLKDLCCDELHQPVWTADAVGWRR